MFLVSNEFFAVETIEEGGSGSRNRTRSLNRGRTIDSHRLSINAEDIWTS